MFTSTYETDGQDVRQWMPAARVGERKKWQQLGLYSSDCGENQTWNCGQPNTR